MCKTDIQRGKLGSWPWLWVADYKLTFQAPKNHTFYCNTVSSGSCDYRGILYISFREIQFFQSNEKVEGDTGYTQAGLVAIWLPQQPTSEKAMAPHSSTLAWKIPWTEEPGRLQSMGSLRVGHKRHFSLFTFLHWRRKWQPTPVFLPGESQGQRSLVCCRLWDRRVGHE